MAGVLVVEAPAQVGGVAIPGSESFPGYQPLITGVEGFRFCVRSFRLASLRRRPGSPDFVGAPVDVSLGLTGVLIRRTRRSRESRLEKGYQGVPITEVTSIATGKVMHLSAPFDPAVVSARGP